MTTINPVAEYVLFKQVITKNASGIILPESAKDADLCKNVVREVGDKVTRVRVGDEIIVIPKTASRLSFHERKVEEDLLIVKEENIIAVIRES